MHNLFISEANFHKPPGFKDGTPMSINILLFYCSMYFTINFNYKSGFMAEEINDEPFDQLLPPKFYSRNMVSSKILPEFLFCGSR